MAKKWCEKHHMTMDCEGDCWNNCLPSYQLQQFNYECPDCHGKFNMPIYKYFSIPISRTDGNLSSIGHYSWVCPFCERKMEGLS